MGVETWILKASFEKGKDAFILLDYTLSNRGQKRVLKHVEVDEAIAQLLFHIRNNVLPLYEKEVEVKKRQTEEDLQNKKNVTLSRVNEEAKAK